MVKSENFFGRTFLNVSTKWKVKVIGFIPGGYYETEITDGDDRFKSCASRGEIMNGLKKGYYREIKL